MHESNTWEEEKSKNCAGIRFYNWKWLKCNILRNYIENAWEMLKHTKKIIYWFVGVVINLESKHYNFLGFLFRTYFFLRKCPFFSISFIFQSCPYIATVYFTWDIFSKQPSKFKIICILNGGEYLLEICFWKNIVL